MDSAGCLLLSCVQVGQIEVITFKSLGTVVFLFFINEYFYSARHIKLI